MVMAGLSPEYKLVQGTGYRSWMVELDWDLARKKTQGSPGPGTGVASRIEL